MDGEALLRFVLAELVRIAKLAGGRDKIQQMLETELIRRAETEPRVTPKSSLERLSDNRANLVHNRDAVGRRMAIETDDARYEFLGTEFDRLQNELSAIVRELELQEIKKTDAPRPAAMVDAALVLFDDILRVASDPDARSDVLPLLDRLGLRIGLKFAAGVKGTKGVVRRLVGGTMAFGGAELPVRLHGRDRIDADEHHDQDDESLGTTVCPTVAGKTPGQSDGIAACKIMQTTSPPGNCYGHEEGISFTKVNRGDRI